MSTAMPGSRLHIIHMYAERHGVASGNDMYALIMHSIIAIVEVTEIDPFILKSANKSDT